MFYKFTINMYDEYANEDKIETGAVYGSDYISALKNVMEDYCGKDTNGHYRECLINDIELSDMGIEGSYTLTLDDLKN